MKAELPSTVRAAVVGAMATLLACHSTAQAISYTFSDYNAPEPDLTTYYASGISDSATSGGQQIVGGSSAGSFVAQRGAVRTLAAHGASLSVYGSSATSGQVAGTWINTGTDSGYPVKQYGFATDSAGGYYLVALPNAILTRAFGINDSGQVVGISYVSGQGYEGFVSSGSDGKTTYTTISGPRNSTSVTPLGINDDGQIVGSYTYASGPTHGFLLASNGTTYTNLDDPEAGTGATGLTQPSSINSSGQIVGYYQDANGDTHGFVYGDSAYTTLDDPDAAAGAIGGTQALGINDDGQIVGDYRDASGNMHAFLATPNTVVGAPVPGYGMPVPEPATFAMLGPGFLLVLGLSRLGKAGSRAVEPDLDTQQGAC